MEFNIDISNKKDVLKYFHENGWVIVKIMSWSLASFPKGSITVDTEVLLPELNSAHFLERASICKYDPQNIYISYNMCNSLKIRLFDEKICESLIFYDNGKCIVSKYLDDKNGDFSPCKIITNDSTEFYEKEKNFQDLWEKSKIFDISY